MLISIRLPYCEQFVRHILMSFASLRIPSAVMNRKRRFCVYFGLRNNIVPSGVVS
jgi:hypothetical protein